MNIIHIPETSEFVSVSELPSYAERYDADWSTANVSQQLTVPVQYPYYYVNFGSSLSMSEDGKFLAALFGIESTNNNPVAYAYFGLFEWDGSTYSNPKVFKVRFGESYLTYLRSIDISFSLANDIIYVSEKGRYGFIAAYYDPQEQEWVGNITNTNLYYPMVPVASGHFYGVGSYQESNRIYSGYLSNFRLKYPGLPDRTDIVANNSVQILIASETNEYNVLGASLDGNLIVYLEDYATIKILRYESNAWSDPVVLRNGAGTVMGISHDGSRILIGHADGSTLYVDGAPLWDSPVRPAPVSPTLVGTSRGMHNAICCDVLLTKAILANKRDVIVYDITDTGLEYKHTYRPMPDIPYDDVDTLGVARYWISSLVMSQDGRKVAVGYGDAGMDQPSPGTDGRGVVYVLSLDSL